MKRNFMSEWLRGRVLRWLASGGQDVEIGIQGAHFVTVTSAGQVIVNGGQVLARGCQVLQNSTGEKILTEPELFVEEVMAAVAKPVGNAAAAGVMLKSGVTLEANEGAKTTGRSVVFTSADMAKKRLSDGAKPRAKDSDETQVKPKPRSRVKAGGKAMNDAPRLPAAAGKNNGWSAHNKEG